MQANLHNFTAGARQNRATRILTEDDIRSYAPSVFATQPWEGTSDKYMFVPTSRIMTEAFKNGFVCVKAGQANTRIEGKGEFTKHVLRFRHQDSIRDLNVGDIIPEVVLTNSHDRTSGFIVSAGLFRLACSNGLMVSSASIDEIRVRHMGGTEMADKVIEGTFRVLDQMPTVLNQVDTFKRTVLSPLEQKAFVEAAMEVRGSTLEVDAGRMLQAVRHEDNANGDGSRDLWRTMNVVQEKLVRGGIRGVNANNRRMRLRGVTSVDADSKLNRALWSLTEKMAALKAA